MRTLLLVAGAAVWGVVVFVFALHVHFPGEEVLDRAKYEVEQASDGGWAIDAESLDLWRVSGVEADGLVLYDVESKRSRRRRVRRRAGGSDDVDNAEDEQPALKATPFVRFDTLRARVPLLALLFGTQQVDFDAELLQGSLEGSYGRSDARTQFELDATDLDLSMVPLKGKTWEVNAIGALQLESSLDLNDENPRESTGELRLRIDQLAIESAKAMGIELTPVAFTEAAFDVQLANGKAEITKGILDGDLIDATISGNVSMSKREASRWRMRVNIKLELDETLDQFARFSPDLKDARDDEGVYHLSCMGVLTRPNCTADRVASGKRGKSIGAAAAARRSQMEASPDFEPVSDEDRDAAREERRRKRMERIQARRDRLRQERKADDEGEDLDEVMDPPPPEFLDEDGPRPMRMPREFQPQPLDPDFDIPVGPEGEPYIPEDLPLDGPDGVAPPLPPFDDDDLPEPY